MAERILYSGGTTSDAITITGGSLPVLNRAVEPGHDATLDRTWGGQKCLYKTSQSSGTVKASAGVIYGWIGTTGAGSFELKDGNTSLGIFTVSAGVVVQLPGITCATNISISASVGVGTFFYL
jgi:hypothetical protein